MIAQLLFWGSLPIILTSVAIVSLALSTKSQEFHQDSGMIMFAATGIVAMLYLAIHVLFL